MNTKYISSNVLKISVISRVRSTSKISDIFQHMSINIFGIYRKKSKFSFYFFPLSGNLTFFSGHFSIILLGSARLVG